MTAQDISKHKWKNRVLIIITDTITNKEFKSQISKLQQSTKDFQERKLIIYTVTPHQYALGLSKNTTKAWLNSSKFYKEMYTKDATFEVILIGMDGTEKLRQTEVLTSDKLFALIDGMPMRRYEIIKNN